MKLASKNNLQRAAKTAASMAALLVLAAGCALGPNYKRPTVNVPPDWGWKLAEPADDTIRDDWWKLFNDPVLNGLEDQATKANQQLQVAVARVD